MQRSQSRRKEAGLDTLVTSDGDKVEVRRLFVTHKNKVKPLSLDRLRNDLKWTMGESGLNVKVGHPILSGARLRVNALTLDWILLESSNMEDGHLRNITYESISLGSLRRTTTTFQSGKLFVHL